MIIVRLAVLRPIGNMVVYFSTSMKLLHAIIAVCILSLTTQRRLDAMLFEPMCSCFLMEVNTSVQMPHEKGLGTTGLITGIGGRLRAWVWSGYSNKTRSIARTICRTGCNKVMPDTYVSTWIWEVIQERAEALDIFKVLDDEGTPCNITLDTGFKGNHFFEERGACPISLRRYLRRMVTSLL